MGLGAPPCSRQHGESLPPRVPYEQHLRWPRGSDDGASEPGQVTPVSKEALESFFSPPPLHLQPQSWVGSVAPALHQGLQSLWGRRGNPGVVLGAFRQVTF